MHARALASRGLALAVAWTIGPILSPPDGTIRRQRGESPMPDRPPDVAPEIQKGDLSEELLQAYLTGPDLAVDTETMGPGVGLIASR